MAVKDIHIERKQRTRSALLAATRAIIEEEGFEALTMLGVADRAGVSRRTVYLHFSSRTELVTALFGYVADREGLEDSIRPTREAPDALTALVEWARHLARYHRRTIAITRAVDRVRRIDQDAARHWETVVAAQLDTCRLLATGLAREQRLAPPWTIDTATDMLWALISSDMIEGLLLDRQWSSEKLSKHLAALFRRTFACESDSVPEERASR
jgi:AcrR family transcriptional regulator